MILSTVGLPSQELSYACSSVIRHQNGLLLFLEEICWCYPLLRADMGEKQRVL